MKKSVITAQKAPAAVGPYSHAVMAGDVLFTSGQLGLDPVSGELIYANYFEGDTPARSCVQVAALPKGGLVEIEAVAVKED